MSCVVRFLFWQLQDVATWAWNTLCLQGFLGSLLTRVIQVFGAWRNEKRERLKIFRSKRAAVERKGRIFRGKKCWTPKACSSLTSMLKGIFFSNSLYQHGLMQERTPLRERERAGWLGTSRKSWVPFIIYKFHFVHIFRDIKRLVVMQFVLSVNANPQR